MSVLSRWRGRLSARTKLEQRARSAYIAHPTPAGRAKLAMRRVQVAFAQRVVRRNSAQPTVSATALRVVAPWLTRDQAQVLGQALGAAFDRFHITTPARAAAAVAQFAHESAGFHTTTEYASGAAYEGRRDLGNTQAGDGQRYRGRGYIQITGRSNYAALSKAFGVDFIAAPVQLASPQYAALASCWWWARHGCNELADGGDFVALTRRINGGENGLADRQAYHRRALSVAKSLVPR